MITAVVRGTVTSTVKHPTLAGVKLLLVQPVNALTGEREGYVQVAVDTLGAGVGQRVLLSGDGLGTQRMLGVDKTCPARLAVGAILEAWSIQRLGERGVGGGRREQ
jgi:microcompartment protein CcmK/EutM